MALTLTALSSDAEAQQANVAFERHWQSLDLPTYEATSIAETWYQRWLRRLRERNLARRLAHK